MIKPFLLPRATGFQSVPAPLPAVGGGAGSSLSTIGLSAQITGALLQSVGSYWADKSQKEQIKSQALNLEFQEYIGAMNARQAEQDAQALLAAGRGEIGRLTARAGQERARRKVSAASRGVVGNVGSAAEVLATDDLVTEIDSMTINRNTVRAAGQARTQSTNFRNQSLLAGVSAGNLRRTASSIRPWVSGFARSAAALGRIAPQFAGRG